MSNRAPVGGRRTAEQKQDVVFHDHQPAREQAQTTTDKLSGTLSRVTIHGQQIEQAVSSATAELAASFLEIETFLEEHE